MTVFIVAISFEYISNQKLPDECFVTQAIQHLKPELIDMQIVFKLKILEPYFFNIAFTSSCQILLHGKTGSLWSFMVMSRT